MQKRRVRKVLRALLAVLCGAVVLSPPARQLATSPGEINLPLGQAEVVPIGLPLHTRFIEADDHIVHVREFARRHAAPVLSVTSTGVGDTTIHTRLFGILPWKAVHVHVVPQETVYVGGQSIGVNLHSKGVIVVGYQQVDGVRSPAAGQHIQVGDVIEAVNGQALRDSADLQQRIQTAAAAVLTIRRGEHRLTVTVQPIRDQLGVWHLGLYVRDKAAGVGTLTFYEPHQHRFGALGHIITDVDTGQPIVGTGSVYEAEVTGLVKGVAGKPGEKRGRFSPAGASIGHIDENTQFGVFGSMQATPRFEFEPQPIPVALPSQVKDGPAKMLTVLHGRQVEAFTVQIETTESQNRPEIKSMVIHVTDPRLLREAGGIVQGMSGSPLVQDGKLIGAVTHVFVSDPTRGYGVYAEWMLHEANSDPDDEAETGAQAKAAMSKSVD